KVPRCGRTSTTPKVTSLAMASRTGVRLTPKRSDRLFSEIFSPGKKLIATISSRKYLYNCYEVERLKSKTKSFGTLMLAIKNDKLLFFNQCKCFHQNYPERNRW